jgi:uncharacterized ion transporter superfamily protein YfcC
MAAKKLKHFKTRKLLLLPFLVISLFFVIGSFSLAKTGSLLNENCPRGAKCQISNIRLANGCGAGSTHVKTSINFGCYGNNCNSNTGTASGYPSTSYCYTAHNGIIDLLFAVIRFLSDGVGLVVIVSIIIGGIQYITSRGDPNATGAAIKRLTSALTALLIFIFAYAILNYVIPNGFFHQ